MRPASEQHLLALLRTSTTALHEVPVASPSSIWNSPESSSQNFSSQTRVPNKTSSTTHRHQAPAFTLYLEASRRKKLQASPRRHGTNGSPPEGFESMGVTTTPGQKSQYNLAIPRRLLTSEPRLRARHCSFSNISDLTFCRPPSIQRTCPRQQLPYPLGHPPSPFPALASLATCYVDDILIFST